MDSSEFRTLDLHINGETISETFEFLPYQSLMLKILPDGTMKQMDITFVPKEPVVRPREKQRMNF